jgi:hypothetical protein
MGSHDALRSYRDARALAVFLTTSVRHTWQCGRPGGTHRGRAFAVYRPQSSNVMAKISVRPSSTARPGIGSFCRCAPLNAASVEIRRGIRRLNDSGVDGPHPCGHQRWIGDVRYASDSRRIAACREPSRRPEADCTTAKFPTTVRRAKFFQLWLATGGIDGSSAAPTFVDRCILPGTSGHVASQHLCACSRDQGVLSGDPVTRSMGLKRADAVLG